MSADANSIALGLRSIEEITGAVRASGLVRDLQIIPGDGQTIGRLIFVRKDDPSQQRRVIWVFDGSIGDHRDVLDDDDRTLLSTGAHDGGGEILEAAIRPFGGYVCANENIGKWTVVESADVEFSAKDQFRIEIAKIASPKEAQVLFRLMDEPGTRKALVEAIARLDEHEPELPAPAM